jgi:hypothetical protein
LNGTEFLCIKLAVKQIPHRRDTQQYRKNHPAEAHRTQNFPAFIVERQWLVGSGLAQNLAVIDWRANCAKYAANAVLAGEDARDITDYP